MQRWFVASGTGDPLASRSSGRRENAAHRRHASCKNALHGRTWSSRPLWFGTSPERLQEAVAASTRTSQGSAVLHDVELEAVDERFAGDRAGVGGAIAKRLPIAFTRAANVFGGHGRERQQLDGIDLDDDTGGRVTAADFDLRAPPESDRHGDLAAGHSLAKLATKHHSPTLRRAPTVADDLRCRDPIVRPGSSRRGSCASDAPTTD